jgi:septum formation protein
LVLASASPRRRELLARAGLRFEVRPADVPEERAPGEAPAAFASRLAREKARAVAERLGAGGAPLVLGADTIVVLEGAVFGKPRDVEHAVELLVQLAGRTHSVFTGVAVLDVRSQRIFEDCVESRVTLHAAPRAELRAYAESGEPLDKAGAYAFQGRGRQLVAKVEGSETNVIGLPLEETLALLREAGWQPGP